MPRLPINYAKTIIYKLVCNDLNIIECYVGHTTDFTVRKKCHKNRCQNESDKKHNLKVYKTIRDTGGWENYSMVEIEKYPCKDSREARSKEREWYEILNSNLNTYYPERSKKEYNKDNADKISARQSQYNKDNADKISAWQSQYNKDNADKISAFQTQYRKDNADKMSAFQTQYRKDHIEKTATYNKSYRESHSAKFLCECGKEMVSYSKKGHLLTKFHQQFITDSPSPEP
jgi:hypothetical protein